MYRPRQSDLRREKSQAQHASDIGGLDAFGRGKRAQIERGFSGTRCHVG